MRNGTHYFVEVREGEPQHIGNESSFEEDESYCELPDDGAWLGLEQCDACGGSDYILAIKSDRVRFEAFAVCTRDEDSEDPEGVGCGAEYRVRLGHQDDMAW